MMGPRPVYEYDQCGTFPGIGPEAESNHVTLRIKYGKIPKKTGISPDPAAESKVGCIPPFWHPTVASSMGFVVPARVPFGQERAPAVASTPARRFCATRPSTLCFLDHVQSAVWSFPRKARDLVASRWVALAGGAVRESTYMPFCDERHAFHAYLTVDRNG